MNPLYMEDSYTKEFEATVTSVQRGGENKFFVVLDNTAFYPNGGGQPYDTGTLVCDGAEYPVVFVGKFSGKISHEVSKEGLKEGDRVKGSIDWERRHMHMRYHTASHIISGIINRKTGALITGNQLGIERSRIDFSLEDYDPSLMQGFIDEANQKAAGGAAVKTFFMQREDAEKEDGISKLAKGLPPGIKEIRIVEIEGIDRQADGGTHVRNTSEIGKMELIKCENKGKNNRRLYFRLS